MEPSNRASSFLADNWPEMIAVVMVVLGLLGKITGPIPYIPGLTEFYQGISSLLIILGMVSLLSMKAFDYTLKTTFKQIEKNRLLLQIGSPYNASTVEAARQLRHHGWLSDGSLHGAFLFGANLSGAYLSKADLSGATLGLAELKETDLSEANLTEADLSLADLSGANLRNAVLWKTNLHGANLSGANFEWTNLIEADLSDADLTGAKELTPRDLAEVIKLEGATMPDGSQYEDGIWMPVRDENYEPVLWQLDVDEFENGELFDDDNSIGLDEVHGIGMPAGDDEGDRTA